ncbi:MAG TPA: phenylacetate-CoA oxygenase subunit PaaJ [Cyclobacteriaceae bacterium]|nr:phenylacetate-CoA oxygenase subunit PaaJ [Cyclobacteriaceae bacterium]
MVTSSTSPTKEQVFTWLDEVKDPEIPVLSLVDLGVITEVEVSEGTVTISMTPTFVGCPALEHMKTEVIQVLQKNGIPHPLVNINLKQSWSSDRITERGREALKKFGYAPPPSTAFIQNDLDILEHAVCPRCNGTHTEMRSPFGPTLCRSLHYCYDCREAFEQFKPL